MRIVWRDDVRSARACKLPGLPIVDCKPSADQLLMPTFGSAYRGRYPDRALSGTTILGLPIGDPPFAPNWEKPPEDPEDGCPGAWYRTPWVDSIDKYTRSRDDHGGRNDPLRPHEHCSPSSPIEGRDWLIADAVRYLEIEEDRAIGYRRKIAEDRLERKLATKQPAQTAPAAPRPSRRVPGGAARGRGRR